MDVHVTGIDQIFRKDSEDKPVIEGVFRLRIGQGPSLQNKEIDFSRHGGDRYREEPLTLSLPGAFPDFNQEMAKLQEVLELAYWEITPESFKLAAANPLSCMAESRQSSYPGLHFQIHIEE